MERPQLHKPLEEDTEDLAKLLDWVKERGLDAEKFKIRNPRTNKMEDFNKILAKIDTVYPDREWLETLVEFYKWIPLHLRNTKEQLLTIFFQFIKNHEERCNFIERQEEYIEILENRNATVTEERDKLAREAESLRDKRRIVELEAKLEAFERLPESKPVEKPKPKKKPIVEDEF